MSILPDTYTWKARIQPAALTGLPAALAIIAWTPPDHLWWSGLSGSLAWAIATGLLAELGRDRGKRMESKLFRSWNGAPATQRLRLRGSSNPVLIHRLREKAAKAVPDLALPSEEEEQARPEAADEIYETVVAELRERARGDDLVFHENCSYGFRRNLWGLRPLGIAISLGALLASGARVYIDTRGNEPFGSTSVVAAAITTALLIGWLFWFTRSWVRIAADAYANALFGFLDRSASAGVRRER